MIRSRLVVWLVLTHLLGAGRLEEGYALGFARFHLFTVILVLKFRKPQRRAL